MPRPMLLFFLLMVLMITSQFEWKQSLDSDTDSAPNISVKHQRVSSKEDAVKEKIILSQEQSISQLNELVQSLKEQLLECRRNYRSTNSTSSHLAENTIVLEKQQTVED